MAYLNKVMLIGNVGKEPMVKTFPNGKMVALSMATSRRYKDNNGEQKEQTDWHNIVAFGKLADVVVSLGVTRGSSLYVEGRITTRGYNDKDGVKRFVTEISMENFQILGGRKEADNRSPAERQQGNVYNSEADANADDDMPW